VVDANNKHEVHNGAVFDSGRTEYSPDSKWVDFDGHRRQAHFHSIIVESNGEVYNGKRQLASSFAEATRTFLRDGWKVLSAYLVELYMLI